MAGSIEIGTPLGRLRGLDHGGHAAFLGIRYAESPAGGARFTAPVPAAAWTGVCEATSPAPAAPQDPLVPPPFRAEGPESEDCLFLNVFTPGCDDARRPVLFWIHGGGFSHGSGAQPGYDGGPLAERGDVVVVTISYRLGALGYLYLGDRGGAAWGAATNAGQRDQIEALRWVAQNMAAFGGDPGNVTVFGQSAGAVAVSTLLAMPATEGLIARAVAQSGSANHLGDTTTAALLAERYLDRLGVPDADPDRLRSIAVADLLAAQGQRGALSPIVDGDTLPVRPLHAIQGGAAARVPLMIGTTRDEQKLYARGPRPEPDEGELVDRVRAVIPRRAGDRASEAVEVYRSSRATRGLGHGANDVLDALATASRFRMPSLRMAEAQAANQPNTFVYQFDQEVPTRNASLGACHGSEIPYVFGTLGREGGFFRTHPDETSRALAANMMDAWIAFARTGDPSHPGIGTWPGYDTTRRATMVFGPDTGVQDAPFEEERALWRSMMEHA